MGGAFPCSVAAWGAAAGGGAFPGLGLHPIGSRQDVSRNHPRQDVSRNHRVETAVLAGRRGDAGETFKEHSSHARPATRRAPDTLTT